MNFTILRLETVDSTNTAAADHARRGADEGVCIVADEQTGGKGRQGRSWTSNRGSGLYMSLVLRPDLQAQYLPLVTLAAAIAVYDFLRKDLLIEPDIKWPNDILVGGKKICGILAEAVETPKGLAVILGIGINLETPPREDATSLKDETSFRTTRDEILAVLLDELDSVYSKLQQDPRSILEMWTQRSSYAKGLAVAVTLPSGTVEGMTDGLEGSGGLRLKLPDGSVTVVHAGDVQKLRTNARSPF